MASLIKKIKKGHSYYYAVESARVNGKPRIVWQKYLGTLDSIVKQHEKSRPAAPKEAVLFEAGAVAALLRITQRLGVLEVVNKIVPKREQGPTVGEYMLLAALNRALAPCSKLAIGDWYEQTILKRLWRYPKTVFSSQRFWDHMDRMREEDIKRIEEELVLRVKKEFGLDSRVLLYDTTNFFTFLATSNDRARLPMRGNSKAKRHDLRQVGLALLVTRDFQIPVLHHIYEGNIPDVKLFPAISQQLIARFKKLTGECREATLVFDKGNVSEEAMERLIVENVHFTAALSANRVPELFAVANDRFSDIPEMAGTRAFSTRLEIWGKQCQAVVVYTESFFTQQLFGVTQNLVRCQRKLAELRHRLSKQQREHTRGKKPSLKSVRQQVKKILSVQFMQNILKVNIYEKNHFPDISYSVDHSALRKLSNERLGKTVLVTDQLDWIPCQVIESYRNLAHIEETFKNMKNLHFLRWQPAYHWTDQKLRVHGFYCVLALLLCSLAHKTIRQAGVNISLPALLKELSSIREVALFYPPGTPLKSHITLSRMSEKQKKLAQLLEVQEIMKK
ncbi:MAG: IS1634 family transposase [Candidatus Cloacimonadia bacterium]